MRWPRLSAVALGLTVAAVVGFFWALSVPSPVKAHRGFNTHGLFAYAGSLSMALILAALAAWALAAVVGVCARVRQQRGRR